MEVSGRDTSKRSSQETKKWKIGLDHLKRPYGERAVFVWGFVCIHTYSNQSTHRQSQQVSLSFSAQGRDWKAPKCFLWRMGRLHCDGEFCTPTTQSVSAPRAKMHLEWGPAKRGMKPSCHRPFGAGEVHSTFTAQRWSARTGAGWQGLHVSVELCYGLCAMSTCEWRGSLKSCLSSCILNQQKYFLWRSALL